MLANFSSGSEGQTNAHARNGTDGADKWQVGCGFRDVEWARLAACWSSLRRRVLLRVRVSASGFSTLLTLDIARTRRQLLEVAGHVSRWVASGASEWLRVVVLSRELKLLPWRRSKMQCDCLRLIPAF